MAALAHVGAARHRDAMSEHFIRDAMGRPLAIGDKVILTNGEPPMYTIVDMRPMVHPNAPPGAMLVVLQNTFKLPVEESGTVIPYFVRTMSVQEQALSEASDQTNPTSRLELTDLPKGKPS